MYLEVGRDKAQKLKSSKAQKLSSWTRPSCTVERVVCTLISAWMLTALGCNQTSNAQASLPISAASVGQPANAPPAPINLDIAPDGKLLIDAGIIFANKANYLCFPFEKLGLTVDTEVTTIETSCECVQASVLSNNFGSVNYDQAILLEFKPEATAVPETAAVDLGVIVTLHMANDLNREFRVDVMQVHSSPE